MANPYRKNPSLFASEDDYDYIVDSGSSRAESDEKARQRTMKESGEQAKKAEEQNSPIYSPADMKDKNIGTRLSHEYKDDTQDFYNEAKKKRDQYKDDIDKLNLNDEKAVVDKAREILSDNHGMVCYGTAAGVAMILDERGEKYTIQVGYAECSKTPNMIRVKNADEGKKMKSNHVWVETEKGKIYSWFDGDYSNTTRFFNITDDINLKKRGK